MGHLNRQCDHLIALMIKVVRFKFFDNSKGAYKQCPIPFEVKTESNVYIHLEPQGLKFVDLRQSRCHRWYQHNAHIKPEIYSVNQLKCFSLNRPAVTFYI